MMAAGAVVMLLAAACGNDSSQAETPTLDEAAGNAFSVSVSGVAPGATMPIELTCDGADAVPEISTSEPPAGTTAYVLLVEDLDAPTPEPFVHWVLADIDATASTLDTGAATAGINDFGRIGWGGPCPPPGDPPHEYAFQLYALADPVGVAEGANVAEVREAIGGRVLALAQVSVHYGR